MSPKPSPGKTAAASKVKGRIKKAKDMGAHLKKVPKPDLKLKQSAAKTGAASKAKDSEAPHKKGTNAYLRNQIDELEEKLRKQAALIKSSTPMALLQAKDALADKELDLSKVYALLKAKTAFADELQAKNALLMTKNEGMAVVADRQEKTMKGYRRSLGMHVPHSPYTDDDTTNSMIVNLSKTSLDQEGEIAAMKSVIEHLKSNEVKLLRMNTRLKAQLTSDKGGSPGEAESECSEDDKTDDPKDGSDEEGTYSMPLSKKAKNEGGMTMGAGTAAPQYPVLAIQELPLHCLPRTEKSMKKQTARGGPNKAASDDPPPMQLMAQDAVNQV
jgi:hypothetical protein